jgi:hypothetical protein
MSKASPTPSSFLKVLLSSSGVNLLSSKSGSSSASLAAGSFPFSNFFRRRLSSSSSSLRPRFDAISSFSDDRRFIVLNREEDEEVKKKMISLWKKQGRKQGRATGRGSYIDKTRNHQAPLPPPTTPLLASTCHSIAHRAPSQARSHALPFTYAGWRRGGAMMSGPLVNGRSQTAAPFQYPFIFYYNMAEAPSSTFNPRDHHLLQLQS